MIYIKSKSRKTNLFIVIVLAMGLFLSSITFKNKDFNYETQALIESNVSIVIKDFTIFAVDIGTGGCECGKVVFLGITIWDGSKHKKAKN